MTLSKYDLLDLITDYSSISWQIGMCTDDAEKEERLRTSVRATRKEIEKAITELYESILR